MSNSNTQWPKIKNWNKVAGQTRYLLKYGIKLSMFSLLSRYIMINVFIWKQT